MAPTSQLRADLYNAAAIPTAQTLPDGSVGYWQPTVVTLISGASEAVLVDTLITTEQGIALADWVEETLGPARRLAKIYITHGHGDHFFNLAYLRTRFPAVEILATQKSIDHMATQLTPEWRATWNQTFPGQIGEDSFQILATPLQSRGDDDGGNNNNKFTLEGHTLEAIDVGHSDTDGTTFLHVPSLDMVVAGDIVYNDVHMWMAESPLPRQREAWIRSIDALAAYRPAVVVASHHRPGGVDGAFNIGASKEYIASFGRLAAQSASARELYDKVLAAHPSRIGKLVLWLGCQAIFPPS